MNEAPPSEEVERPVFRPDQIAGGLMLAFFGLNLCMDAWSIYSLSRNEFVRSFFPSASPARDLATFVGFVTELWYSVGVLRGRRWAFVIAALYAAGKLVPLALYYLRSDRLSIEALASLVFSLAVFLYCGLRALGKLGPREGDRLDLREQDDEPTAIFQPDCVAGALLVVFRMGVLLWGSIELGGAWLRAMLRTRLTLPEWLGASQWSWLSSNASLAVVCLWLGLGVVRGRAWASLLGLLLSAQCLLDLIGARRPAEKALPTLTALMFGLYLALFLYYGLRVFGNLGPRSGDRFALRDP